MHEHARYTRHATVGTPPSGGGHSATPRRDCVCEEYLRPNTGGKSVPSKFSGLYLRMHQRVIAALAWLSGNPTFLNNANESTIIRSMLHAYKVGEHEARLSMDDHAVTVKEMVRTIVLSLENVYHRDTQWDGWH
eukprot:148439-Prymnesium_polylepis.1